MFERFASFSQGRWDDLLIQSRDSAVGAVQAQVKRRRRVVPNCPDIRAERAHKLIQLGELSAVRQPSKVILQHQATMPLSNRRVILNGELQPQGALWLLSGSASTYWWDDEVVQGEGGEQGDPLMPALYALGQHRAVVAINDQLLPTERLLAFLDDLYVLCSLHRVADVHIVLQQALWEHSRISVHHVKTKIWNRAGEEPRGRRALTAAARLVDPVIASLSARSQGFGNSIGPSRLRASPPPQFH